MIYDNYYDIVLFKISWKILTFCIQQCVLIKGLDSYLSMNRVHLSSSKEGSHLEQLQQLKSNLIILK